MPHIDELLGVATVAAAGMFVAITLQPLPSGKTGSVATAIAEPYVAPVVRLPSVEVVTRQSHGAGRIARAEKSVRQPVANGTARPRA